MKKSGFKCRIFFHFGRCIATLQKDSSAQDDKDGHNVG